MACGTAARKLRFDADFRHFLHGLIEHARKPAGFPKLRIGDPRRSRGTGVTRDRGKGKPRRQGRGQMRVPDGHEARRPVRYRSLGSSREHRWLAAFTACLPGAISVAIPTAILGAIVIVDGSQTDPSPIPRRGLRSPAKEPQLRAYAILNEKPVAHRLASACFAVLDVIRPAGH